MEWTAREDLKHRLWAARVSIERFIELQRRQIAMLAARCSASSGFAIEEQKLSSQADAAIDELLNSVNNLRRALRSRHLPLSIRGRTLGRLNEPIRHVRNIREHWDENRGFWAASAPVPPGGKFSSARWYLAHFPDKTPWGSSWSNVDGSVVGGIIHLDELLAILDELETAVSQA